MINVDKKLNTKRRKMLNQYIALSKIVIVLYILMLQINESGTYGDIEGMIHEYNNLMILNLQ